MILSTKHRHCKIYTRFQQLKNLNSINNYLCLDYNLYFISCSRPEKYARFSTSNIMFPPLIQFQNLQFQLKHYPSHIPMLTSQFHVPVNLLINFQLPIWPNHHTLTFHNLEHSRPKIILIHTLYNRALTNYRFQYRYTTYYSQFYKSRKFPIHFNQLSVLKLRNNKKTIILTQKYPDS